MIGLAAFVMALNANGWALWCNMRECENCQAALRTVWGKP